MAKKEAKKSGKDKKSKGAESSSEAKVKDKKARKLAAEAPQAGKDKKAGKAKKSKAAEAPTAGEPAMPSFKHVAKKRLTTGKGASAAEIGASLVQLFNQGKSDEVERRWHHKKIESIEGDGMVFLGAKGIAEKNAWWFGAYEMHAAQAEGPFVGATGFTVHFTMEISPRAGGPRMSMREVGVYTVEKGKIVREEFMGLCPPA
jgi:hypothetical protein